MHDRRTTPAPLPPPPPSFILVFIRFFCFFAPTPSLNLRIQRLREAADSRSHLKTPPLRDLGCQPYTFVAKARADADDARGGNGMRSADHDEWDDWGDEQVTDNCTVYIRVVSQPVTCHVGAFCAQRCVRVVVAPRCCNWDVSGAGGSDSGRCVAGFPFLSSREFCV